MDDSDFKPGRGALLPPSRKATPPFEALRAFDAVARLRGIRKAARSLGRDHAVISRHLRSIEMWVGTRLIERTSRGIVLTEDGLRYHKEISAAMDAIANATIDLMRRGDNHRIHLRCAPGFALHWMSRRVGAFEQAHPDVEIQLRPTDRMPDFASHDTDIDIQFVTTYGPPLQLAAGLRSKQLARVPIVAVASPAYLEKAPKVHHPRDLLRQRLLHEYDFDGWANWLAAHDVFEDMDLTGPRLWQGHLTLDAAIHGRGVALINLLVAADELASGRLIEIGKRLDSFLPRTDGVYYLVTRADRWEAPLIRKFRHWLMDATGSDIDALNKAAAAVCA